MLKDIEHNNPSLTVHQIKLSAVRGPLKGRLYGFASHRIKVGKAEDNDLVIPDDTVSRHHFEILRFIDGFVLRDKGSTNGTLLDGAKIREAYIKPGSIVSAGDTKLKFFTGVVQQQLPLFNGTSLGPMVFKSDPMRKIASAAKNASLSDLPFLVLGEKGTGKKTFCTAVHETGKRKNGPLVFLNSSNSFPSIKKTHKNNDPNIPALIKRAEKGSLIIEEPWDLSAKQQRILFDTIEHLSSEKDSLMVRFAATSSRDLTKEVEKGRLNCQLASYLSSLQIKLSPLRDRKEDIGVLISHFMDINPKDLHGVLPSFLIDLFHKFDWPCNISELKLMLETCTSFIGVFPERENPSFASFQEGMSFREHKKQWIDSFERSFLKWLFEICEGNISKASRKAAMDRKHLNKLLKRHEIKK